MRECPLVKEVNNGKNESEFADRYLFGKMMR